MATTASVEHEELPAPSPDEVAPRFAPLYRQIKTLLTKRLRAGEWKPGEPIPSETELAARFRVSQGTVRKAIDELAADNLLVRRQGRGTFVASHLEVRTQFRFLRLRPDDLPEAITGEPHPAMPGERSVQGQVLRSQVLECRRARGSAEISRV
ncbi:MAG: hypothetical protein RL458_1888, partial [Pseudomonadota bacterium]